LGSSFSQTAHVIYIPNYKVGIVKNKVSLCNALDYPLPPENTRVKSRSHVCPPNWYPFLKSTQKKKSFYENFLVALTAETAGELDVLALDSDTLGVEA
jgi:hypothetical protein